MRLLMTKYGGLVSRYRAFFWRTFVYAKHVRETARAPPTYLIAAKNTEEAGATGTPTLPSDMYRLRAPVVAAGGVTLQEFIGSFLTSPLFRLELAILKWAQLVPPPLRGTLEPSHLERVASNQADSFANWTDRSSRGDPARAVLPASGDAEKSDDNDDAEDDTAPSSSEVSPTRIMRCRTNGGEPFCDTWWSVEPSRDKPGTVDLVFGTALLSPPHESKVARWTVAALDPFHRLYSRLLLASARANLEVIRKPQTRSSRERNSE